MIFETVRDRLLSEVSTLVDVVHDKLLQLETMQRIRPEEQVAVNKFLNSLGEFKLRIDSRVEEVILKNYMKNCKEKVHKDREVDCNGS